ncbi:hypothetical protein GC197_01760 [bacterium]|nr:hypothetical protein [bacterium]
MGNIMDGPMDRPLLSTSQVGIVLILAILPIAGCGSSELSDDVQQPQAKVAAPKLFHAPMDVRPVAQLAAHLEMSQPAHEAIVAPYQHPKRLPPVPGVPGEVDPTPLETIRFPIKIERSESSAELPQLEPIRVESSTSPEFVDSFFSDPPLPSAATPRAATLPTPAIMKPDLGAAPPQRMPPDFLDETPQVAIEETTEPLKSVLEPSTDSISLEPPEQADEPVSNPAEDAEALVKLPEPPPEVEEQEPQLFHFAPPGNLAVVEQPKVDHVMLSVRGRMNSLVDHGLVLAQRGAYFSARAEFIQALRLATQTLDTEEKSQRRSEALADAITALDEAGDFIPNGSRLEADVDLGLVVSSHRTGVLKGKSLENETALTAAQEYFHYAQEKLHVACGGMPEAARALVGLGRIQQYLYNMTGDNRTLIVPRSMALYQTALATDRSNYEAANELGVLLARYGQLEEAKQVLLQGIQSSPQAELWQNLASVHKVLGEVEMAQRATTEAQLARQHAPENHLAAVRIVSPQEMSATGQGSVPMNQTPGDETNAPLARRQATSSR